MSDELYYSKSKGKHIKIAEMPDVHVRRAFIKMNKDVSHIPIYLNWESRIKGIRDSLTLMLEEIEDAINEKENKD